MDVFKSAYRLGWESMLANIDLPNPFTTINVDQIRMRNLFIMGRRHAEEYTRLMKVFIG